MDARGVENFSRLYRWWGCDVAPLPDWLRITVYLLLLWLWRTSHGPWTQSVIRQCPSGLFRSAGIMSGLEALGMTPDRFVLVAEIIRKPLLIVWLLSVIGIFGRWPPVLTAAGLAYLWGVYQSSAGTGHIWHLPAYTLLILAVFAPRGPVSADGLISRAMPSWPFNPDRRAGPDVSGYARKLVML